VKLMLTYILMSGIPKYKKYYVNVAMAILFKIIGREGRKQKNEAYVAIDV